VNGGVPIARVRGIEVRISLAWAIVVALVTFIGAEQATLAAPALAAPLQWLVGLVVSLVFLVTVVAHELAHALVGRSRGLPVRGIVLGFVGASAPLAIEAKRPRDELAIALSGPLVSLAVAAVALSLALGAGLSGADLALPAGALLVVGGLNLVLALMSLLPGMPLDGGRVVRALAWAGTGDRDRASRLTVRVGRLLGWALVASGVVLALLDMITGGFLLLGVGWLLATGAGTLSGRLEVERLLRGSTVADATRHDIPRVTSNLTVDTFIDRYQGEDRVSCLPVVDGETVVGVIGMRRIRRLGRAKMATTRASEIVQSPPAAPFLAPGDDLWTAVESMNRIGADGLAVVVDGRLDGVVMRESIGDLMVRLGAHAVKPGPAGDAG
jgi:Zn-dependent protease